MVWRGPMVTQALTQLLTETRWRDVDYLIIDMPPGTGDIQLTLAQQVPVTGAVIVTTPQDIALLDARKGLKMFEKVGIPILGIVENMSIHICSKCGHAEHIFGSGGGDRMAKDYEVEMLGALPLAMAIREQMDGGKPTVEADPDGAATRDLQDHRAPHRGQDRRKGQGPQQQVPQHQGDEHLISVARARRRPAEPGCPSRTGRGALLRRQQAAHFGLAQPAVDRQSVDRQAAAAGGHGRRADRHGEDAGGFERGGGGQRVGLGADHRRHDLGARIQR
jgi:hypothetical protein